MGVQKGIIEGEKTFRNFSSVAGESRLRMMSGSGGSSMALKQKENNPYSWQLAFVPGIQYRMAGYPGTAQIPPTRKQGIGH